MSEVGDVWHGERWRFCGQSAMHVYFCMLDAGVDFAFHTASDFSTADKGATWTDCSMGRA